MGSHKGSFKQGWRLAGAFTWPGAFGNRVLASDPGELPNHFKLCKLSCGRCAINYMSML